MTRPFDLIEKDQGIDLVFNWGSTTSHITQEGYFLKVSDDENNKIHKFRFYQFSDLLNAAITHCVSGYEPRRKGKFLRVKADHWANFLPKYRKGMVAKQQKLLSKAFKPMWERLLAKADQNATALDKNLQRAKGPKADLNDFVKIWNKVKDDKWVLRDCTQFIPAILYYLNENGQSWRHYYANGNPYKALNQTLDAIKYPLSFDLLGDIREIKFERPVLTRLELLQVLNTKGFDKVKPFIFGADYKELKKGIKQLYKIQGVTIDFRKTRGYGIYYLADYLRHEDYNGTFTGLIKRSHEWHERMARDRTHAQQVRQAQWEKEHAEELAKDNMPPEFNLAELDKKVRFLPKVKDLHDEGKLMKHCVSGYSSSTLTGQSFIFHVDHAGDMATVELNRYYKVQQAQGVANKPNKATEWAKKYFFKFVTDWRKKSEANTKLLEPCAA